MKKEPEQKSETEQERVLGIDPLLGQHEVLLRL